MKTNIDPRDTQRQSIIHNGIVVKGELTGEGHLTISGCVEGGVDLKGGQLIITQTGYVEGNVSATHVHIDGEVRGSISVKKKVSIGSNARVLGNVISKTLDISEGAKCNGFLEIGNLTPGISQDVKIQEM